MPTLPRSKLSVGNNTRKKTQNEKKTKQLIQTLNNITNKHKVGPMTFKSPKLVTVNGKIMHIDPENIVANLKSSVMIIKCKSIAASSSDTIYDVLQLELDKKAKDEKKYLDDLNKNQKEIDEMKKSQLANLKQLAEDADGNTNAFHQQLLQELINRSEKEKLDNTNNETTTSEVTTVETTISEINMTKPTNQAEKTEPIELTGDPETIMKNLVRDSNDSHFDMSKIETTVKNVIEDSNQSVKDLNEKNKHQSNENNVTDSNQNLTSENNNDDEEKTEKNKMQKAVDQYKDTMKKKSSETNRNKYHRNLMKDIKDKFTLEKMEEYRFLEVKANITDMVIENTDVYKLKMPPTVKETYLLIIGDIQLKSQLLKTIDPNYNSEKAFEEQMDFLDRIKSKESTKVTESDANTLEVEPEDPNDKPEDLDDKPEDLDDKPEDLDDLDDQPEDVDDQLEDVDNSIEHQMTETK